MRFGSALALSALFALLVACGGDGRPRCSECGMYADVAPAFASGLTDRDGHELRFDAPRCLFRFRLGERGRGAHDVWVTEHYSQRRASATGVVFVAGSDVTGPMGRDLIPVAPSEAERFVRDHRGRVLREAQIDAAALRSLDP